LKQEWDDTELNKKLHLFSNAGDTLIDKEKYDKVMLWTKIAFCCAKSDTL
jgi:hypothetical protein